MTSSSLLRFRMKTRKRNIQAAGKPQSPISESSRSPSNKKFRKEEGMGRSLLTRSGLSPSVALISYNIERETNERQYVSRCRPRLPRVEKSPALKGSAGGKQSDVK